MSQDRREVSEHTPPLDVLALILAPRRYAGTTVALIVAAILIAQVASSAAGTSYRVESTVALPTDTDAVRAVIAAPAFWRTDDASSDAQVTLWKAFLIDSGSEDPVYTIEVRSDDREEALHQAQAFLDKVGAARPIFANISLELHREKYHDQYDDPAAAEAALRAFVANATYMRVLAEPHVTDEIEPLWGIAPVVGLFFGALIAVVFAAFRLSLATYRADRRSEGVES